MNVTTKINAFYRLNENGDAVIYDADTGENATTLDADVYPVGSDESARFEHPSGIILTICDAESLCIAQENHEDALHAALTSRATDYIRKDRTFSEFKSDLGWADWMEDYTEADEGDDISEVEERAINDMLNEIWNNTMYNLGIEREDDE